MKLVFYLSSQSGLSGFFLGVKNTETYLLSFYANFRTPTLFQLHQSNSTGLVVGTKCRVSAVSQMIGIS